ncbi:gamma-glutamylcyclotransferase [Metabacillus herbersteinensis]|uniref:Gamma-glutamylcyclotransferase n=1 Tax=Metabacillus herbersteinensis TaxID=283816 RepID=A0ABV6GAV6_9BACI
MNLFVYDSTRRHMSLNQYLEGAKLLAEQASTEGELLCTSSDFPALIVGEGLVYGELYEVDDMILKKLEWIEHYKDGDHIVKKIVKVSSDQRVYDAWCYVSKKEKEQADVFIKSGDWKEYCYQRNLPENTSYFAYGSCMDNIRFKLASVDHHFTDIIGTGILPNYSLRFTFQFEDGGRADIVEDGGTTEGILYSISKEGLTYLYMREGVLIDYYRPTFVDILINGEVHKDCLTFVVKTKKTECAPPAHYLLEIIRGATGRLSEGYVKSIEKHATTLQTIDDLEE